MNSRVKKFGMVFLSIVLMSIMFIALNSCKKSEPPTVTEAETKEAVSETEKMAAEAEEMATEAEEMATEAEEKATEAK